MSENEDRREYKTITRTEEGVRTTDATPTVPDRDPQGETRSNNPIPPRPVPPPRDDE